MKQQQPELPYRIFADIPTDFGSGRIGIDSRLLEILKKYPGQRFTIPGDDINIIIHVNGEDPTTPTWDDLLKMLGDNYDD